MLLLQSFPLLIHRMEYLQSFSHFGGIIVNPLLYQLAELFAAGFDFDAEAVEPDGKTETGFINFLLLYLHEK